MTVQIGELVRTLLTDDLESYAERTGALDEQGWNAFGEVVGAAFYRAVGQRFGFPLTPLEDDEEAAAPPEVDEERGEAVSAFVAEAAEPYAGTAVSIDQPSAEALVRSVLGDEDGVGAVLEELDEPDLARIELVLLRALIADGSQDSVEDLVLGAEGEAAGFTGGVSAAPGSDD